jgi:hypothetical protein
MQKIQQLLRWMFWLSTVTLVTFCLLFGLPVVSAFSAGKVLSMAGCKEPGFETTQALCPPGSYAELFAPLAHWFTSLLAPYVLLKNFGGMLGLWLVICIALGLAHSLIRAKNAVVAMR